MNRGVAHALASIRAGRVRSALAWRAAPLHRAALRVRAATTPTAHAVARRARAAAVEIRTWGRRPDVREAAEGPATAVDAYWSWHLVRAEPFLSAADSAAYLEWRFREYPRYRELMGLWGSHDGEVLLDYGCGPADDTVGFLLYTRARRVIGMDVSKRALDLARTRIALHRVEAERVELVHVSDATAAVPLPDASVDFVHCSGVLQHTSAPAEILAELHRVLRPGGRGSVMVYNRDSVWFHLYVAYVLIALGGDAAPIDDVFRRSTDGPACPVSTAYDPQDFLSLLGRAGFQASFEGGYLSRHELDVMETYARRASLDERLPEEHRSFLDRLEPAGDGLPQIGGLYAGIGGVYRLSKADV